MAYPRRGVILIGRQGSGKGTQGALLAERLGSRHISTGDCLRAAMRDRTDLGRQVEEFVASGRLVPDQLVSGVVAQSLADAPDGFVLDGFPRTVAQAVVLEELIEPGAVTHVLELAVPTGLVASRLAARRVCEPCGTTGVRDGDEPPHCPSCGEHMTRRRDDHPDAIARRLASYDADTMPVLDFYRKRGLLATVDGTGSVDHVAARILAQVGMTPPAATQAPITSAASAGLYTSSS